MHRHGETIVVFVVAGVVVGQLCNLLLGCILLDVLCKTLVRCLIHYKVLRLDVDQVAQEGREEKRAHHGNDE